MSDASASPAASSAAAAAAASACSASTPLVIHVSGGRFLVWRPEVCRALAVHWRIMGEWGPPRQRQQSWGGASSCFLSGSHAPATPVQSPSSDAEFIVESLPMMLMPAQALFLLHHPPTAKLLRIVDASSLAGLRASSQHSAAAIERSMATRLAEFERKVDEHTREVALKRKQFVPDDAAAATVSDASMQSVDDDSTSADAKRRKMNAADSAASASHPLPAASSYAVAIRAFDVPPDAVATLQTGHPQAILLPVLHPPGTAPLLVSQKLNQLELRTALTQERCPAGTGDWAQMQRIIYAGICEALGLQLHDPACAAASSASGSAVPAFAGSFLSSPRFRSFLCLYGAFRHLWSEGFYLLPGLHFGADLVAYEDLPAKVHSSYIVKLLAPQPEEELEGESEAAMAVRGYCAKTGSNSSYPSLSMALLSGLARMASGINKAVMLVQMRSPQSKSISDAAAAGDAASSAASCSCLESFRAQVLAIHASRQECTTFQWSLTPSLANAPFDQSHLKRTRLAADWRGD